MIKQFNDLSSWRKEDITLKANELYTVNFIDTNPNVFVLANANLATLKVGISSLPRTDSFEFKVDYNTTEVLGRPIGTHNLYILNDSSLDITVTVFSIETEFNPEILKNLNVELDGYELKTATEISGVKDGVNLPVNATIKGIDSGVSIPIDPEIAENQQEIISSLANLKSVHLNNLYQEIIKLAKETTFTTQTNSILTKLDTLISGQGSGGGGTSYDDTELLALLTEWKNSQSGGSSGGTSYDDTALMALLTEWKAAQDWTNLATKLSSFDTQLSELLMSMQSDESNTLELHKNVKKLLNALTVFEDETVAGSGVATYLNNVTSFSFTASKKCKIHFGWLFYDGGSTANLKIGDTTVLTIMANERLTDFELELAAGDVVTLTSTEPIYRIKYWTY